MSHDRDARTPAGEGGRRVCDGWRAYRGAVFRLPMNIQRVAQAIGVALHILPEAGGIALILRARLCLERRRWLASECLWSLDAETAEALAEATLNDLRCGPPRIPFLDVRNEAREWAEWASPGELRAYMAACWNRLPNRDRQTFIRRAIA